MERKLAHVETVVNIEAIEGCDNIEYVTVLGWHVIQRKDTVKVGDKVVYIEIDSKVPDDSEPFAFLESRKYKVKTIKMRGVISQGLIMTFEQLGLDPNKYEVGDDLTEELGITKIETEEELRLKRDEGKSKDSAFQSMTARHKAFFKKPWVKKMMRHEWFRKVIFILLGRKKDNPKEFPSYIHKTDETRVENMPWVLNDREKEWVLSEKCDGTSTTFAVDFRRRYIDFVVCSRNVRQVDMNQETFHDCPNTYWEMAFKYNIKEVIVRFRNRYAKEFPIVILQGETIGESLQGNPYKLDHRDFYAFNLILCDPAKGIYKRYDSREAAKLLAEYDIKWVPILGVGTLPATMEEMKQQAEGKSVINPNVLREGIVYRSLDGVDSFKNVSNTYLLKHNG